MASVAIMGQYLALGKFRRHCLQIHTTSTTPRYLRPRKATVPAVLLLFSSPQGYIVDADSFQKLEMHEPHQWEVKSYKNMLMNLSLPIFPKEGR